MTEPAQGLARGGGRLLRLRLNRPKANLIDAAMIAALDAALAEHLGNAQLARDAARCRRAAFQLRRQRRGASAGAVRGHARRAARPGPAHGRIAGAGAWSRCAANASAAGSKLALAGHLIFVAPDANLGQPEMKLGVFAPAASCLLPELIGPAARARSAAVRPQHQRRGSGGDRHRARSGGRSRTRGARLFRGTSQAEERELAPLRRQGGAARLRRARQGEDRAVERLYLDELMNTHDAVEGLEAFIAKRSAQWQHR